MTSVLLAKDINYKLTLLFISPDSSFQLISDTHNLIGKHSNLKPFRKMLQGATVNM